ASEKQVGRIDVSAATLGRSDMVVARCWQQWITEGRVYRRGGHPVPSRETIRRRLTEVGFEEPTSAKTLTTDPTS
ncbi:hypothetical protein TNCV_1397571, partial [Trichonephila clavipes]